MHPRHPHSPFALSTFNACLLDDGQVYVYAAKDGYAKLSTIASHQCFVTHVDFSTDGNYVQSADGAGALLFADAATGIQIPSESLSSDGCRQPCLSVCDFPVVVPSGKQLVDWLQLSWADDCSASSFKRCMPCSPFGSECSSMILGIHLRSVAGFS